MYLFIHYKSCQWQNEKGKNIVHVVHLCGSIYDDRFCDYAKQKINK